MKVSLKPSSFSQSPIKQPQMRAFPICGPNFLVKGKRVKVSMKPSSFYVDEIHLVKGEPFDQKGRIFLVVMAFLGLNLWGRCWLKKKKNEPKGWWFHQNRRPFKRSVGGQNRRPLQNPKPSPPGGWQNRRPFWGQHHHLVWVLFIFWSPIQGGFPCEKRTREETQKKLAYGPTTEFQSSANIYIYYTIWWVNIIICKYHYNIFNS